MKTGPKNKLKEMKDLEKKIEEYFEYIKGESLPPTISRLAYSLGYASRQSLYDAMNRQGTEEERKISYIIKKAVLLIEVYYEESLTGQYSGGPIFWLKNRGWSDKQEIEHSGKITNKVVEWTPANQLKKK
jgi:hypothetical protein